MYWSAAFYMYLCIYLPLTHLCNGCCLHIWIVSTLLTLIHKAFQPNNECNWARSLPCNALEIILMMMMMKTMVTTLMFRKLMQITSAGVPYPPCVCVGTNDEVREKWHDECMMKWWWPSTDTMCPLVVPNVIIPPPPTHPPTPPYQTLHAYVWERMRKRVRSEWWHDECMMKWWWPSTNTMCPLVVPNVIIPPHPPTHPPVPDPPCVCVGTNEEVREKWVMARWMHDEMVMIIKNVQIAHRR